MASVHDLDHIKLDLGPTPSTSTSAAATASSSSRPSQTTVAAAGVPSKLEPILLLAKNARGAAAARVIADATAAPGVYVFGELLDVKGIAELADSSEHASHYALLETFAYRTWKDYRVNATSLPKLNPAQETKLKHLSIVSLASQSHILPYQLLLEALDVPTVRHLEDLIIEAIYAEILDARLDQKHARLEVDGCMGRDVRVHASMISNKGDVEMEGAAAANGAGVGTIEELSGKLGRWSQNIGEVLVQLDSYISAIRQNDAHSADAAAYHNQLVSKFVEDVAAKQASSRATGGSFGEAPPQYATSAINGDAMDVDGTASHSKMRSPPGPSRTRKRGRN